MMATSPTTTRSSGSDFCRRSRIKTVVSRRFTSSYSSQNDEEVGLDAEEDEYLSCFEESPDSDSERRDVEEEIVDDDTFGENIQLRPKSLEVGDKQISPSQSGACYNSGRLDYNQSSDHQNENGFKNHLLSTFCEGDHGKTDKSFYETSEPQKSAEDIDFVDMAISRDDPDMGLRRVDPNYNSRQKQKLKLEEKIPKLKKFKPTVKFGCFDICIGAMAIVIFFIDIGTDIELAAHYFREEMWMYGGVTTGLIVVPSLVTCFLGFHWYVIDYKKEKEVVARIKKAKRKAHSTPNYVWFLRFALTLLQVGPVVRIVEYLRCGHKSICTKLSKSQRRRFYIFMLYEDVDSCLLRLFESFLESAPQLTWQLYITIVLKPSENVVGTSIRYAALLSSWGSLAISLVSYHKSLRNSHEEKAKMSFKSLPIYFIWRASEVGGRVICIAMFASAFKLWVFGILLFHWGFTSFWLMIQETTFYKNKCLEKAFNVICGYVMIFCFLNLREGVTRYRFLFFYFITYFESFLMLALWFRFSPDLGAWFHIWGFIVVLVLFLIHIIFQLLYYALFHPTGNIEMCLTCDPNVIYSSTCHDIAPSTKDVRIQTDIRDSIPESEVILDGNGDRHYNFHNHKGEKYHQTKSTTV